MKIRSGTAFGAACMSIDPNTGRRYGFLTEIDTVTGMTSSIVSPPAVRDLAVYVEVPSGIAGGGTMRVLVLSTRIGSSPAAHGCPFIHPGLGVDLHDIVNSLRYIDATGMASFFPTGLPADETHAKSSPNRPPPPRQWPLSRAIT